MGTQVTGTGRKRIPNRERLTAEDDALNQIAREAEARLAAKRAARAEAREIRMKELERQQKEIYQSQKKYYGLDNKWGHIEQWMEESERYSSRHSRRNTSVSDDEERMSVGSRGSLRGNTSDLYCGTNFTPSLKHPHSTQNGRPSVLFNDGQRSHSHRGSVCDEALHNSTRRFSGSISRGPSDYSGFLGSNSRASSRASSARASPVVEERADRDFLEKGSRTASTLSAATLASLGGPSSRRGSCDTSISVETEASIRDIKDSLVESEEKFRKAMVSNAQLDNEKSNLMYQVDTLKESLIELEEQLAESKREHADKVKDFERERHAHSLLQLQFNEMKETLKQSEDLLTKHGIALSPEVTTNGDAGQMMDEPFSADYAALLSDESQPSHAGESVLGKKTGEERQLDHGERGTPVGGRMLQVADNYFCDQDRTLVKAECSAGMDSSITSCDQSSISSEEISDKIRPDCTLQFCEAPRDKLCDNQFLPTVSTTFEGPGISSPTLNQIPNDLPREITERYELRAEEVITGCSGDQSQTTESEMTQMFERISAFLVEAKTNPGQTSQGSFNDTEQVGQNIKIEIKFKINKPLEHQSDVCQVTTEAPVELASTISNELLASECPSEHGIKSDQLLKAGQNSLECPQPGNEQFGMENSLGITPIITDSDEKKISDRGQEAESSSLENNLNQIWHESLCDAKEDEPNTQELQSTISDKKVSPFKTDEQKIKLNKLLIPDLPARLQQTEQGKDLTSSPTGEEDGLNDGPSAGYLDSCEDVVLLEEEVEASEEVESFGSSSEPAEVGQKIEPIPRPCGELCTLRWKRHQNWRAV
ncbi:leucine-rich repeat flightless-interacting protein 1 isoform X5 [Esox lucius]|uniref:leucine-rich repeat flightless-interacting protein 1 isoform X5 n=1 Tax=Esox lucius TaxID=8010 RepID=UPI001477666B|nr:leucine-rich repeat flightless-interacting protein 1 isoform X5 [Esox lucius]